MSNRCLVALALSCAWITSPAQTPTSFDAAAAFGARPSADNLRLSPDGTSVAYIVPAKGQGSIAYTLSLSKGAKSKLALGVDGKPFRIAGCHWVSNDRLVCIVYAAVKDPDLGSIAITRTIAVDADGKNVKLLSTRQNEYSRGIQLGGGSIIDWLPDENGAVLMTRHYVPDDHVGSHLGSSTEGLGVDWIDTRTLKIKQIEVPRADAVDYITDGRGTVRIIGFRQMHRAGEQATGIIHFSYRPVGSRDLRKLSDYDMTDHSGFYPVAVDHDLNVAYGYKKKDGRRALYAVTLNDSLSEQVIYERPDVDVSGVIQIGRRNRVVGASYSTDFSLAKYFAPDIKSLIASLDKALPGRQLGVVDCSIDEKKMLISSASDNDPGVYYILDRTSHEMQTFFAVRAELEGVKLANVKPVTYPAADGTRIPAYLTLPPGREDAKGLPAIVLPHGGPEARDEWGFDWLPQFFAARGYAVLQPNFRGSTGYGDEWFQKNGFRSWKVAIGDVTDGGRWLVHEGIADPAKLGIVGWSYGGYAALQSAVVDPKLFKAVVAIAPVTDLAALKEDSRHWTDFELESARIGDGPQMHEGSPIEHAEEIKAPVLLFHGGRDANVNIQQSKSMASRLKAVGAQYELVTWDDLDHQLDDSEARTQMLRKSDEFLRKAFGM